VVVFGVNYGVGEENIPDDDSCLTTTSYY